MSDKEGSDKEEGSTKKFFAEYAKSGRAACKLCKTKIDKNAFRLAKAGYNPFGPGLLKLWHHPKCLFEVFKKQRATTLKIETPDDIEGWSDLEEAEQREVLSYLSTLKPEDYKRKKDKPAPPPKGKKGKKAKGDSGEAYDKEDSIKGKGANKERKGASKVNKGAVKTAAKGLTPALAALAAKSVPGHKDNTFREFRRICVQISEESAYTAKTAVVKNFFEKGTSGGGFKGDLRLWVILLLPQAVKRVYNLQSKQLVKLFSRILRQNQDDMLEDLEQGDVAETIRKFFVESKHCVPPKSSKLTVQEVDSFLRELTQLTREDDQAHLFSKITEKCTANDLMYIIRLVKNDLRINAGAKHILEALHPDAYKAFQTSRDLDSVIEKVFGAGDTRKDPTSPKKLHIDVKVMTPVLPMLAEACKSMEQAFKKCPNGMYSEIKYDGERVQLHKSGSDFKYFSRSLKPVMAHKVKDFHDIIPKAFPGGEDLILDSEILMIDTKTGQPLPFGTLGIHKKGEYKDACVCLFVFDCIYYNGKSLLHKPMRKRRKILHEHMTEIPNRILFSEYEEVHNAKDLNNMLTKVFQMGLEGLILKDLESIYEPGKRHWLKVKKDYLFGGVMADTADLVVLGAWFGTGQKGGMMSVFLMGCWDEHHKRWCTVTKVHTGHDDKTLEKLQTELQMEKISKDVNRIPKWLHCTKTMVPDFVAKNPKEMPVWEITGAEFTKHEVHTADGISIRFPRVSRIRDDKTWQEANSLAELKCIYAKSKDTSDFQLPSSVTNDDYSMIGKTDEEKVTKKKKNDENVKEHKSERSKLPTIKLERESSPEKELSRDNSPKSSKIKSKSSSSKRNTQSSSDHGENSEDEESNQKKSNQTKVTSRGSSPSRDSQSSSDLGETSEDEESTENKKAKGSRERDESVKELDSESSSVKVKVKSIRSSPERNTQSSSDHVETSEDEELTQNIKAKNSNKRVKSVDESNSESFSVKSSKKRKHRDSSPPDEPSKKGLPSIFLGVKIVLGKPIKMMHRNLDLYFTAYGGELLDSASKHVATHVVHTAQYISQDTAAHWPRTARHVIIDWLIDSLKLLQIQKTQPYAVTLLPSS